MYYYKQVFNFQKIIRLTDPNIHKLNDYTKQMSNTAMVLFLTKFLLYHQNKPLIYIVSCPHEIYFKYNLTVKYLTVDYLHGYNFHSARLCKLQHKLFFKIYYLFSCLKNKLSVISLFPCKVISSDRSTTCTL